MCYIAGAQTVQKAGSLGMELTGPCSEAVCASRVALRPPPKLRLRVSLSASCQTEARWVPSATSEGRLS